MHPVIVLSISIAAGVGLFITGFYTGFWLRGHNTETIREKMPPEIVRVPEPKLVEIPAKEPAAAPRPPVPTGGPFLMQPGHQSTQERQEAQRMGELITELPARPRDPEI